MDIEQFPNDNIEQDADVPEDHIEDAAPHADARIVKVINTTYIYKGERRPRTKTVYRTYPTRGRPKGKWAPTQEQIDTVMNLRAAGCKVSKLAEGSGLKQHQVDTILYRR